MGKFPTCLALVALTGCDLFFPLADPAAPRFCTEPEQADLELCADFEGTDGTAFDPFEQADLERGGLYDIVIDPDSNTRAAHLFGSEGNADARLVAPLPTSASHIRIALAMRIDGGVPTEAVTVLTVNIGDSTIDEIRAFKLTNRGNPIGVIARETGSDDFVVLAMGSALPTGERFTVALEIDYPTNTVTLEVDGVPLSTTPAEPFAVGDRLLQIGPHDPIGESRTWTLTIDDVAVTAN